MAIIQHFKNSKTLRKISESGGFPTFNGQNWPPPQHADYVISQLSMNPKTIFWVYGDSPNGGITPDEETQSAIDNLLSLGVPSNNIRWLYESLGNVFVIAQMISTTTMEGPSFIRTAGQFAMSEMFSPTFMEGPILSIELPNVFIMDEMFSQSIMESPIFTRISGQFAMSEMFSPTFMEGPVIFNESGNSFIMDEMFSPSSMDTFIFTRTGGQFVMVEMFSQSIMEGPTISKELQSQTVDMWQDFNFSTLNLTNLGTNDHVSVGTWTIDNPNNCLTMNTSGERTTLINFGGVSDVTGNYGMAYTNDGVAYHGGSIRYAFSSNKTNLTTGFWMYVPSGMTGFYSEHDILTINTLISGTDSYLKLGDPTGSEMRLRSFIYGSGGYSTGYVTLPVNNWYWIAVDYHNNGALIFDVYNSSGARIGTVDHSSVGLTPNDTLKEMWLGSLIGASENGMSGTLYFDDWVINWTNPVRPIGIPTYNFVMAEMVSSTIMDTFEMSAAGGPADLRTIGTYTPGAGSDTLIVPIPSTTVVGDLLILFQSYVNGAPSGWSTINDTTSQNGAYYKIATSAEAGSGKTVTANVFNDGSGEDPQSTGGQVITFKNNATTSPIRTNSSWASWSDVSAPYVCTGNALTGLTNDMYIHYVTNSPNRAVTSVGGGIDTLPSGEEVSQGHHFGYKLNVSGSPSAPTMTFDGSVAGGSNITIAIKGT